MGRVENLPDWSLDAQAAGRPATSAFYTATDGRRSSGIPLHFGGLHRRPRHAVRCIGIGVANVVDAGTTVERSEMEQRMYTLHAICRETNADCTETAQGYDCAALAVRAWLQYSREDVAQSVGVVFLDDSPVCTITQRQSVAKSTDWCEFVCVNMERGIVSTYRTRYVLVDERIETLIEERGVDYDVTDADDE